MVGRCKVTIEDYEINGTANKNIKSGGLLIATRKDIDVETIITMKDVNLQQLWAIIRSKGYSFRLCLAYGYPSENRVSEEELDDWYLNL